jgi:hypothetical protein
MLITGTALDETGFLRKEISLMLLPGKMHDVLICVYEETGNEVDPFLYSIYAIVSGSFRDLI